MISNVYSDNGSGSAQVLKDFQLSASPSSKLDKSYGKKIAEFIISTTGAIGQGYLFNRNARFAANRNWANGRIDVRRMFADRLEMNGKQNYVNIDWKSIMLVNRIISGLVGRWMERLEKIQVTCIDPLSQKAKEDNYQEAEFVLANRAQLEQLQEESGVPMISPDQFVAEDQDDLEMWRLEGQKLPEEIHFELECNNILDAEGWFDVLKEKSLHDFAETGLGGTYTWMDEYGVIHVDWLKPENIIYSYSDFPDFRDTAWRGFFRSMKVSELRRKYGKEFGGTLSEEELWKIAQTAKDYRNYDQLTWVDDWVNCFIRPYDEWNVDVVFFWLKSLDKDSYVVTVTKQNKSTIIRKSGKPLRLDENQEYVEDDYWNLYKGVYVRDIGTILEWGLDKNMIRPQDPKESGSVEFPISLYMYQNFQMRNIAIPEKIEEPASEMILARLKIQQLIAKMVPAGAAINVDALQELDLGLAEAVTPQGAERIWNQTGKLYYRGRDAEGNPIPVPITEIANAGFVTQLQALVQLYTFHYQVLKDELGEDPNLIASATKPRVTTENVQMSQRQADAATDYIYKSYLYLMEETSKKISCLLNASVQYGSQVYRNIMQEEVRGRNFSTKIKMMPTEYELAELNAYINQAIASNPLMIQYFDPFKIKRIAKENIKLAELLFRQSQKRMLRIEQEKAARQQEENAKVQIASQQAKAESDFKLQQAKTFLEVQAADAKSKAENESTFLKGYFDLLKSGMQLPPEMGNLSRLMIRNLEISLTQENKSMIQEMEMEAMAAQMEQQQAVEQQMQQQQNF